MKSFKNFLDEKLKVSDGLGAWITDFQDSDAPQFKNADSKKRRDMAIAAFTAAGGKLEGTFWGKILEESDRRITDIDVEQAKRDLEHAKLKKAKEKVQKEDVELDEDTTMQLMRRLLLAPKMKKMVRFYLDWRRDNPGKGNMGVQKVIQMMGLNPRDGNQLIDTLNDLIKQGKLPKHLALNPGGLKEEQWGSDNPYKKYKNDPDRLRRILKKNQEAEGSMRNRIRKFVGSAPSGLKDELRDIEKRIKQIKDVMREEAEQIDEISRKLARKAAASSAAKNFEYGSSAYGPDADKEMDRLDKKADKARAHVQKRQGSKGLKKVDRMTGKLIYGKSRAFEEVELEEGSESWEDGYKRRVVKTTKPEHKEKGYNWRIKGKDRPEISIKLYKEKPSQAEFNKQMKRVAGHEFGG